MKDEQNQIVDTSLIERLHIFQLICYSLPQIKIQILAYKGNGQKRMMQLGVANIHNAQFLDILS